MKITSKYNKKYKDNIFNKTQCNTKKHHKKNNFLFFTNNKLLTINKSINDSQINKDNSFFKDKCQKQTSSSLFNNLFLREKQKKFSLNSVYTNNYHLYLNSDIKNNKFNVIDNNSKMYKSFLSQNKSNFNNKYKMIYHISDIKQKDYVIKLFNSIKKKQNKENFDNYLSKRCYFAKKKNLMNSKNKTHNNSWNKKLFLDQSNNFMNNISHRNNLIKIKTIDFINDKSINNEPIFYKNNALFKTMPFKKKKKHFISNNKFF
jgi:hypothetical protein